MILSRHDSACPAPSRLSVFSVISCSHGVQFGCERIRRNTFVPGGRPQKVSLMPFRKLLLKTDNANQFVVVRLVENSGWMLQPFVPVERSTILLLTARLRMRIVGGGGAGGGTVIICAPKKWTEQM